MRIRLHSILVAGASLAFISHAQAMDMMSDEETIKSAESAAPAELAKNATIIGFGSDMKMKTLREGTNGFTCMPDDPNTPGADPMCVDKAGMAWAEAWMTHTTPPEGVSGFGFMLAGGSDASNTDPYATGQTNDNNWITTGPHVMVFNPGKMAEGYPADPNPDPSVPYVMWAGTPYEHLMIPVE